MMNFRRVFRELIRPNILHFRSWVQRLCRTAAGRAANRRPYRAKGIRMRIN